MDKIVSFNKRLEKKKQKETLVTYRSKIRSLRRSVQCSSCHLRCAMCGIRAQTRDSSGRDLKATPEFFLCEDCRKEYEDFVSVHSDGKSSDFFWHNDEWLEMWSSWLRYRSALRAFIKSPEFKLLLQEDIDT